MLNIIRYRCEILLNVELATVVLIDTEGRMRSNPMTSIYSNQVFKRKISASIRKQTRRFDFL